MSGRLDGWTWVDNPRSGGGTYDPDGEGYPYRIVVHTIEGRGFPNLATHPYPPQMWYNPATREKAQTVPLDRSAFALYQGATAPYYTNRARALQVEMVGFAAEAGGWPDEYLRNIARDVIVPLVEWVRAQGGDIDLSDPAVPLPGAIPNSAREDAPQRLDPHVWAFGPVGLVGHRHVPMGDDHWDAGALDTRKVAGYARELLGSSSPATTTAQEDEDIMRQYRDVSDGTVYAVHGLFKTPLESDAVRQSWMTMGILSQPDMYFEQAPGVLAELPTVDQTTFGQIMSGVSNSYANLSAQLAALGGKFGPLADAIAAAVVAKVGVSSGGVIPPVTVEGIRQAVHDELGALVLKAAA